MTRDELVQVPISALKLAPIDPSCAARSCKAGQLEMTSCRYGSCPSSFPSSLGYIAQGT